jgi:hypothetical protein
MRKIKPLKAAISATAKHVQSSTQFVVKTRVCFAISSGTRNRVRRNHISTRTEGLTAQAAAICLKPHPHQVQSSATQKSKYRSKAPVTPGHLQKPGRPRVLGKPSSHWATQRRINRAYGASSSVDSLTVGYL